MSSTLNSNLNKSTRCGTKNAIKLKKWPCCENNELFRLNINCVEKLKMVKILITQKTLDTSPTDRNFDKEKNKK
jgi:hypothetical protein